MATHYAPAASGEHPSDSSASSTPRAAATQHPPLPPQPIRRHSDEHDAGATAGVHHPPFPPAPSRRLSDDPHEGGAPGGAHHPLFPPAPSRRLSDDPAAAAAASGGAQNSPVADRGVLRVMCSYGGRILPRPGDHLLRYVGGETRIVSLPRGGGATFAGLVATLSKLAPSMFASSSPPPVLKYQLPHEDLDSLISLTSDDDVTNMLEELDRLPISSKSPRLRLFVFPSQPSGAFGSVFSGDPSSDQWYLDALNCPAIERGKSEASSIVSEVPDYLFGLDSTASDDPSPSPANPKSDHDEPEQPPLPSPRGMSQSPIPLTSFVPAAAAPPPPPPEIPAWPSYVPQPVYYVPVQMPVQYLNSNNNPVQVQGYMPGPVYLGGPHMSGGERYAPPGLPAMYPPPPMSMPMSMPMQAAAAAYPPPPTAVESSEMRPGRLSQ